VTGGGGTSSGSARRALSAGLRAANSAAALWRSILVRTNATPGQFNSGGSEDDDALAQLSDAGAIDRSWDTSAMQLSSLATRFDALGNAVVVAPGQQGQDGSSYATDLGVGALAASASTTAASRAVGSGPQSMYVAFDQAGRAGTLDAKSAFMRDVKNSLEMSIVAAIPPSPPSLDAMAGLSTPHARHKHHGGGGGAPAAAAPAEAAADGGGDAGGGGGDAAPTPASKIEGSVDAIAQRIYHRIRRRIASDRERFGG
jgi:hypothetical protein